MIRPRHRFRLGLLAAALGLVAGARSLGRDGPGGAIPDPPRQREPWTPPESKVPASVVAAARRLFDLGMADPRGGEYRTVEVAEGFPGGDGPATSRRRGWVLPSRDDARGRLAVGWDGVLYPVTRVGEPADLAADFAGLEDGRGGYPARPDRRVDAGWPNLLARLDAIQVALLLRLGHAALADRAWDVFARVEGPDPDGDRGRQVALAMASTDQVAREFTWGLYLHGAAAFERGDDPLALRDFRILERFAAAAARDAAPGPVARLVRPAQPPPPPAYEYLDRLPELIADASRRLAEPARPPVSPPGRGDRASRVAALVRDLDRIGRGERGRPEFVDFSREPTVLALVAEGDAAVAPLVEVVRRDDRLIRATREGQHRRDPVSVAEPAFYALTMILKSSDFGREPVFIEATARRPEDRRALADRIEAYWGRRKGLAPAERWYLTLADDAAGEREWFAAARQVVGFEIGRPWAAQSPPSPLPGEALRAGHEPTVAALLACRADAIIARGEEMTAAWMADCTLAWDPAAAMPTLRAAAALFRAKLDALTPEARPSDRSLLTVRIARYVVPRARHGDPTAAAEYADLLRRTDPTRFEHNIPEILEPIRRLSDDPAVRDLADRIFADPASPWSRLGAIEPPEAPANRAWEDLIDSGLLAVPGFRRAVLARLGDAAEYGTARPSGARQWQVRTRAGSQAFESRREGDPRDPAGAAPVAFRRGDFVASRLATIEGCPRFSLAWSTADRDAAIPAIRAFVERFGPRLAVDDPPPGRIISPKSPPYPTFDPPARPATAADVAEGRALFTLDATDGPPAAERRVVPLPSRPLLASWEPRRVGFRRPGAPPKMIPFTERSGRVWQAEEVFEDGRWRRHFGIALPGGFAKIPAEEVDFGRAFDASGAGGNGYNPAFLAPPGVPDDPEGRDGYPPPFAPGSPVVVPFRIRNPTGLDAEVPASAFRREGGRVVGVDARLALTLDYSAPAPAPAGDDRRAPFDERRAEHLKPRPGVERFRVDGPMRALGPAAAPPAEEVDLRDLFDLDRPGRYVLRAYYPGPTTRRGDAITQAPGANIQPIGFLVGEAAGPAGR